MPAASATDIVEYAINDELSADEFIEVLASSTLAERRPVEDRDCIEGMLKHANLVVTARFNKKLIGVARSVTDFYYCCYLSDLAVDQVHQHSGIGKELVRLTQQQLGERCKLILLSAPAATGYYPKIGFTQHPSAWLLNQDQQLKQ